MIKYNVKRIVFSSTCATYGEPQFTPIDEKHIQNPINPYGYSKLAVERIMDDYDKAYELKSIRLRYFNVAGADESGRIGEWHEPETHLIPNILKANDNKVFSIFGNDYETRDGTCIRDYVNVLDLAEAHRLAYEYLLKENKTDVFNIGTGEGYSVKEVFDACEKVLNKKIPVEIKGRRAGDPAVLYADISKVKNILGWKPEKSLEDSIKSAYLFEDLNRNKNDFCILVAYHKKSALIKNNCLNPIQVGRILSPYVLNNMIGDDIGDNISHKNYNYAELTAIYWAWKNIKSEYKGLMHYRRFLDLNDNSEYKDKDYYEIVIDDNFDSSKFLNKLKIDKNRIKEILENNLIITRKKEDLRSWGKYTIREHYYAEHIGKHLDMALDIIKNDYPEYYDNAVELIDGYSSYFGNMIIMKSKDFDDYSNFLFDVTSKMDNQINLYDSIFQQYSVHARYNGFLGERLTAIYINQKIKEGHNVAEFPAVVLTTDKNKKWHEYNTYDTTKYNNEKYKKIYIKNNEDITKPKITVAIAAYNVQKYISQAIESVINQTLENIEIIIINDGSTDTTRDIISKYASIDNRIKIINKNNGGLGSVRNLSIEKAEGEYIHLMDGDDYIDQDFLENMVKNADCNNSEMVLSLHRTVNENGNFLHNNTLPYTLYGANLNIFNTPDIMLTPVHTWDKIFLTKFLRDSKIYFPDKGTGEDIVFMYKILLKLNNISILRDVKYNYRFNENSTQSKKDTVLNGINNILITKKYILDQNNYLITEYFQLFIYIIIYHIIFRAKKLFKKDKKFSIEFYNKSKELFKEKVVIGKNVENVKAYFNWVCYDLLENMYKENNYHKWKRCLNNIIGYTSFIENIFSIKKSHKYIIIRLLGIKITLKK